jgi:hypothetical protein
MVSVNTTGIPMIESHSSALAGAVILLVMIIGITLLMIFGILALLKYVNGQDVDPRYYCIEKLKTPYPYSELCRDQVMNEVMKYTDGLK